ncbi:hypothetical protein DMH04_49615 [Kibdelosporangium aridum]|uniref:ABC transporter ATP-binding protein n=1 Tax=Kibdelosporangium aridum TaxID=2030 RepID=A0A428YC43_KIBAR|nr:ATP-binding cassette domain-containing protein [Kibdelosporangium aridum]RSM65236.1 hypothetical protein DMH04_49615 [Kibdelosporangium aridum]
MPTVFYGPFARLADVWHGWRDGRQGIPATHRVKMRTPHHTVLILRAEEAFDHEWLVCAAAIEPYLDEFAAQAARLELAKTEFSQAEANLAALVEPTEEELGEARFGEERRSATAIQRRRRREFEARRRELKAAVAACAGRVESAEGVVTRINERIRREVKVASVRVIRLHEHAHRRLATYHRVLIRFHPDGELVAAVLDSSQPELPEWVERALRPDEDSPARPAPKPSEPPQPPAARTIPLTGRLVIGSSPAKAQIVIDGFEVGAAHAVVEPKSDGVHLHDLGAGAGTFLNGRRVLRTKLEPGDAFDIGDYRFALTQDGTALHQYWLGAADLVVFGMNRRVAVNGVVKPLLTKMSFVQRENSVLAVIGVSGAGKSTLFSEIVGELSHLKGGGQLFFRGMRVSTHLEQLRPRLGYVPQKEEHIPQNLTVRQVLAHTDRWRHRRNRADRTAKIEEVCRTLGIESTIDQMFRTLSGGQKKRVSIAMELLGEPHLLMLDEPTSGLDAGADRAVMRELRAISRSGTTVMVVTHSTEQLTEYADQVLIIARGGRPVYSGLPAQLPAAIKRSGTYADLMEHVSGDPDTLADAYQSGPEVKRAREAAEKLDGEATKRPDRVRGKTGTFLRQLFALTVRQIALSYPIGSVVNKPNVVGRRSANRQALFVCLLPFVLAGTSAAMAVMVSMDAGLGTAFGNHAVVLSVFTTLSVLSGQALTYSNLVEEFELIQREHRTGQLVAALVLAKWLVFAGTAAIQAALAVLVFRLWRPGSARTVTGWGPDLELFVGLAATTIAAMSVGMLMSAVAKDLKQAVMFTSLAIIAQVALNGVTKPLTGDWVAGSLAMLLPARWGLAASASTVDLNHAAPAAMDAMWAPTTGQLTLNLLVLAGLSTLYVVLAIRLLRRAIRTRHR